ncbi:MAG: dihydroneopterin aldolase family protein [Methanosarcinales archaeon]|nr:dihydroneopterin aldolase family protein [Methanosarcinales archaeon]
MITQRDNALFEAGIKLGALYHQFVGAPINLDTVDSLEQAISKSISVQPYVKEITVRIDRDMIAQTIGDVFGYCELEGVMLNVEASIVFKGVTAVVALKFDPGLNYPLMRIINVIEV